MENILLLDTSIGSDNKGDDIIMECVRKELAPIFKNNFEITLPTQLSPFNLYQVMRKSYTIKTYSNCKLKFVGGSNLLVKNLFTHFPQWNISLFNYRPIVGSILVGVGAGAGDKTNYYTRYIYKHLLNKNYCHSVRDERSRIFVESLGLKAINTGCVTMWMLTPDFCKTIPTQKAEKVVFTLTRRPNEEIDERDQFLINTLQNCYKELYFWPQGMYDYSYLCKYNNIENIHILQASKQAYDDYLTSNDTDYVGTRLHGGIYAMRHRRRAIIIAIDERAKSINEVNHLNCIDKNKITELLDPYINSSFSTRVQMDYNAINFWKEQFK